MTTANWFTWEVSLSISVILPSYSALSTESVQLPIFHPWVMLITFPVRVSCDLTCLKPSTNFFAYLIKRKNRLRSKNSVQNGQIRRALQGYKLVTKWRINVSFPVPLALSLVGRTSWVQPQDYVKGGGINRGRDRLNAVWFIVETAERRDFLKGVENYATPSSTSQHCSVLFRLLSLWPALFLDLPVYFFAC